MQNSLLRAGIVIGSLFYSAVALRQEDLEIRIASDYSEAEFTWSASHLNLGCLHCWLSRVTVYILL